MSRGPGKIERAILAAFEAGPDNALTVEDLCDRVYRGVNQIEKKHRVAVVRATKGCARRSAWLGWQEAEGLGRSLIYSVMSYAMARLKCDRFNYYRSSDRRLWYGKQHSENEFRKWLAPRGRYHRYVAEGGAWWRHVQQWIAEREGDRERTDRLKAEGERQVRLIMLGMRETT